MSKSRYKIRFHLAKGENFMKWQVTDNSIGDVRYVDPSTHYLDMYGCKLRNYPRIAEKIHEGQNKTVCAWIQADTVIVRLSQSPDPQCSSQISYNPRVKPYWSDESGNNLDNYEAVNIKSNGRNLFSTNPYQTQK